MMSAAFARVSIFEYVLVALVAILLAGCGRMPDGSRWGADATAAPGWERVGRACSSAAREPETWVPAIAAALVGLLGGDANLSGWATDHTPVFGSRDRAASASDALAASAYTACLVTAVAAPSGEEQGPWCAAKLKGLAVETAAVAANEGTTLLVKRATARERPDASNHQSFPSAHTSSSAACVALSTRNIDSYGPPPWATVASRLGGDVLVAATGWARVEAGRHYLTDVLAGAALGHFIGAFVHDAFMGSSGAPDLTAVVEPSRDGTTVEIHWRF